MVAAALNLDESLARNVLEELKQQVVVGLWRDVQVLEQLHFEVAAEAAGL